MYNDYDEIQLRPASMSDTTPLHPTKKNVYSANEYKMNGKKLSLVEKLCFGIGGLPYQMKANALALFIAPFLLEVAKIRPYQISIVLFAARGWDAVTDPLIGYFVSKTNTRWGKLRPWILFSTPFALASYMMIWYVPNISEGWKTVWYLLFYCLFQTFLSCRQVPYTALTMYLTPDQAERDSATGFRMIFELIGVLMAAGIQGLIISLYGTIPCEDGSTLNNTYTDSIYTTNDFLADATTATPKYSKLGEGYLVSAGIMCIIYTVCTIATFFGTKEMADVIEDKDKRYFVAVKAIFSHKSYLTLLFAFLFNSLSIQIVQTNIALYCKYSIDAGKYYQYILIVLLGASILSLPFWRFTMIKFGKKSTYAAGLILFLPCLFALLYLPDYGWSLYLIAVVCGFGIAVNYLCPWSMLPDVIDDFMIKTGARHESIFYSFYVFFTKLTAGVAVAVSTAFLELSNYDNTKCTQDESVGFTLRLLVTPGPVILLLVALMFIWKHPIDEIRRNEIREEMIKIREVQNDKSKSNDEI